MFLAVDTGNAASATHIIVVVVGIVGNGGGYRRSATVRVGRRHGSTRRRTKRRLVVVVVAAPPSTLLAGFCLGRRRRRDRFYLTPGLALATPSTALLVTTRSVAGGATHAAVHAAVTAGRKLLGRSRWQHRLGRAWADGITATATATSGFAGVIAAATAV